MLLYQILIATFPEFCLVNFFFFGLLYVSFINKHIWSSSSSLKLKYNSLNMSLFLFLLISLFIIICISFIHSNINNSFSFFFNNLIVTPVTFGLEIFLLFFCLLIFFSLYSFLQKTTLKNFECLLLLSLLFSCFIFISKVINLFLIVLILEVILVLFYSIIMYFDFFKTTTLLEAFTKFFLTASIASMLLLLGVLFLYKASGSCNLQDLTLLLSDTTGIVSLYDIKQGDVFSLYMNPEEMLMDEFLFLLLIPSVLFFFCGLLFKFAVVPFHSWSPDLYQVLPTPLIIILSTLPKLIYGLVLFKFMFFSLNEYPDIFNWFVTIIAIFAFIYTVLLLLDIDNIKRFIAYSSIPHILTVFLILLSNNIFYLTISFVYFIIYIASLHSLILLLTFNNTIPQYFSSLKKLFSYNSIMLWLFILILLQLAGLPPFSIFILKLNILNFLMSSGSFILYSLMVISSFYSIYYYMRIIKSIFFDINNFFSLEWNISNYKLSLDSFKMVTFSILLFIQLIFIVQPYIFISPVFYFFTFFDV